MDDLFWQKKYMSTCAVKSILSGLCHLHMDEDSHSKDILWQIVVFLEHVIQIITDDLYTFQYAITRYSFSYIFLAGGEEKMSQLQQTIACSQSSLRMITRRVQPLEWARVHASLGEAYRQATHYADLQERYSGCSVMQEQALRHVEAALQVFTRQEHPLEWARTQRSLGMIYADRIRGARHENLARARDCYEAALLVCECSLPDRTALYILLDTINMYEAGNG